jgi:hypothetical protein
MEEGALKGERWSRDLKQKRSEKFNIDKEKMRLKTSRAKNLTFEENLKNNIRITEEVLQREIER